jgi:predicted CoA-substrate-specific enzyme activase
MKRFLGIDVGSVSTNIVMIDQDFNMIYEKYIRTNGLPLDTIKSGLVELQNETSLTDSDIAGLGTTGSGRMLAGVLVGADVIKNEITCHAAATIHYYPDVRTIFEIGGQDSKIILIQNGMLTDFAMNTVCAAGTGSFLDHQAERLGIPINEFGDLALGVEKDVRIAGRCTVFAESDMISKQQYGFSKPEIIKGLCSALVRNYLNNLGRGKRLYPPFVFQGGVAANKGIRVAFEKEIGHPVIVPEHYGVMGAIGAAILACEHIERTGRSTKFRGFEISNVDFEPTSFECNGCPNCCEIIKVMIDGEVTAMWGDKCGKWSALVRT